jgi:PAS domain S-box-containing protein
MEFLLKQIIVSTPIILVVAITTFSIATLGIQARRRAERANTQLNAILSSLNEGLVVIDTEHRIVLINQAAGLMFRLAPSEVLHKKVEKALFFDFEKTPPSPQKWRTVFQVMNQVLKQQEIIRITAKDRWYGKNKQGQIFRLSMTITPLLQDKHLVGAVLVIENLTTEG